AGGFHPAWNDYRNGMAQLWTATVWVKGVLVAVNGGGGLEGMSSLSSRLSLETISTSYDRQTNRLTFKTVLKNLSKTDTARGPLRRAPCRDRAGEQGIEFEISCDALNNRAHRWKSHPSLPPETILIGREF